MLPPKPLLVILAAGLGSRFGGLKQLNAVGAGGESLMDYSIYDALAVGFEKILLVIKQEMLEPLSAKYHYLLNLPIEFCMQENEMVHHHKKIKREKPWGTAHAVLSAKKKINQPFLVINADDFYGRNSFVLAYHFLRKKQQNCAIVFPLKKTLSPVGKVNRAEVFLRGTYLQSIVERENIYLSNNTVCYDRHSNSTLQLDSYVSMNMWGFTPDIFNYLELGIEDFLRKMESMPDVEYQLPAVLNNALQHGSIHIEAIPTSEEWMGLTYKEDLPLVAKKIKEKNYPTPLWKPL
jgi:NDP-sugar pyrophosphorylase family protein